MYISVFYIRFAWYCIACTYRVTCSVWRAKYFKLWNQVILKAKPNIIWICILNMNISLVVQQHLLLLCEPPPQSKTHLKSTHYLTLWRTLDYLSCDIWTIMKKEWSSSSQWNVSVNFWLQAKQMLLLWYNTSCQWCSPCVPISPSHLVTPEVVSHPIFCALCIISCNTLVAMEQTT